MYARFMTRRAPFTDIATLKTWLASLRPGDQIRTARLLADNRTRRELVTLANEEIYNRTRDATSAEVASALGISERAVRRAVSEHIAATGAEPKRPGRRAGT
jgi:methylphosphotriester-DNA--protein-cysteine methyltransferase